MSIQNLVWNAADDVDFQLGQLVGRDKTDLAVWDGIYEDRAAVLKVWSGYNIDEASALKWFLDACLGHRKIFPVVPHRELRRYEKLWASAYAVAQVIWWYRRARRSERWKDFLAGGGFLRLGYPEGRFFRVVRAAIIARTFAFLFGDVVANSSIFVDEQYKGVKRALCVLEDLLRGELVGDFN